MVETETQIDVWAGLGSAIDAFERGLDEYRSQFDAWAQHRRNQISREETMAEERAVASMRDLEDRAKQLACDEEALASGKAELERFKAEIDALAKECDRRERASRDREAALSQEFCSHEQVAESIKERIKQLDQREHDLIGKCEESERELAKRRATLASEEKQLAKQRHQIDDDQRKLIQIREESARRESELEGRQKAIACENETIAARRDQVDRQSEELSTLQSRLLTQQAEIDARTLALNADKQQIEQQSAVLAQRKHEFEQRMAKMAAEHQKASLGLERRERELDEATKALSARTEGLETVQREIEARQQAVQSVVREHQQREKELAQTGYELTERQAKLEEAEVRLQSSHQALQVERDKLVTMGKSMEAEQAAMSQEWARKEAESLVRRDQFEREQKSVEQRCKSLDRRSEELEQRSETLAERECELNEQQAKLEAALQSLRSDQTAVEEARRVVIEVDESRWSELNKVRAELNVMRSEIELARTHERELEGSLGKIQAAHARELHAAEVARTEAARFAEQLDNEKQTAAQLRTAMEQREQELLTLRKGVEAKSAGSTADPSEGGTLLVQRQASHTAVATFWADFKWAPLQAEPVPRDSMNTSPIAVDATKTETAADNPVSTLPAAAAAERADGEVAQPKESTTEQSDSKIRISPNGKKTKAGNAPALFTGGLAHIPVPEPVAQQPAAVSASIDLDPATANRLRMLRRLNPNKSDQELLARISAEQKNPAMVKRKRGWFALR